MVQTLLQATGTRNCYTQKMFYRLSVKLTPEEWNAVKGYFKHYNFDGLHGWATTKVYDVAKTLALMRVPEAIQMQEKIEEYEKRIENHCENDFILDEYVAGKMNCSYDLSKIIWKTVKH